MSAHSRIRGATSAVPGRLESGDYGRRLRQTATGARDGEEVVNDHTDGAYDNAVIVRLSDDIHPRVLAVVLEVAAAEPRLARYGDRLTAALEALKQGDAQMMAHPLRDSYHTVWFELHEELIRLSGRNRASEAAAGRA